MKTLNENRLMAVRLIRNVMIGLLMALPVLPFVWFLGIRFGHLVCKILNIE